MEESVIVVSAVSSVLALREAKKAEGVWQYVFVWASGWGAGIAAASAISVFF